MKLYEIANEYEVLLDQTFNDETGEVNENALVELNQIKESIEQKSIALASYIKNIEAERKAIEEARESMDKREKYLKNKVSYLTDYLHFNMEKCEITEIKCPYFQIKLKKCPLSVNVLDENIVPNEYKNEKLTITLNKIKIKEELLAGVVINGVELKQNTRIEIR